MNIYDFVKTHKDENLTFAGFDIYHIAFIDAIRDYWIFILNQYVKTME